MVEVIKHGIVLDKTDLEFERDGVLNPAVIRVGDSVHVFYRAVKPGNYSTIGYARLDHPLKASERHTQPLIVADNEYETHGVEDPRIVKIDDLYYLTYTAYDGINALGALATSTDLKHFTKCGIIVPQIHFEEFKDLAGTNNEINEKYVRFNERERFVTKDEKKILVWDKNVIFFPRRINGKLFFLHRIRPDIQIVSFHNLEDLTPEFWKKYFLQMENNIVLAPKHPHEVSYIGGGCPPIETNHGWLLIYHGVHDTQKGYVYSACAALLDLKNPQKEISRLPYALFKPEFDWELTGYVNNVCFPTGTALFDDTLYIYYGAADSHIAGVTVSLSDLVNELLLYKKQ